MTRYSMNGRSGTPKEVAHAVAFLALSRASYIYCETLVADGGNIIQEYKGPSSDYY
jgi:3-oxoacyl-[acyl-carrier protein] reductase